jgi:hypothetical protein
MKLLSGFLSCGSAPMIMRTDMAIYREQKKAGPMGRHLD